MSSSWEPDSRLLLRGGRGALAEGAELRAFLPFWEAQSLPGLRSASEQDEALRSRASLPTTSRLRTLSRWDRDLRLCFTFPSMLGGTKKKRTAAWKRERTAFSGYARKARHPSRAPPRCTRTFKLRVFLHSMTLVVIHHPKITPFV